MSDTPKTSEDRASQDLHPSQSRTGGPEDRIGVADAGRDNWEPAGFVSGSSLFPDVTGAPWPRLVADRDYTPPRLIRWPIVVGIILSAVFTTRFILRISSSNTTSSSSRPYALVANDATFSATFPGKPQRSQQTAGAAPNQVTTISYAATTSNGDVVAVSYFSLPESTTFDLDAAVSAEATNTSGTLQSRSQLTYRGQSAEDAVITTSNGVIRSRVVRFGPVVYLFEEIRNSSEGVTPGYKRLLDTFSPS